MMMNISQTSQETNFRKGFNSSEMIVSSLAVLLAIFQIGVALFGKFDPIHEMAIHLSFILLLTFLIREKKAHKIVSYMFGLLAVSCGIYYAIHAERIATRIVGIDALTTFDILFGSLFVILCFVAARQLIGLPI